MSDRLEFKLWLAHRLTGMLLGVFVVIHLVGMIIAIQGGLSSAEILSRTQNNYILGIYYCLFTIAAAMHSSIGLRTVTREVFGWKGRITSSVLFCLFLGQSIVGISAIVGLVL